MPTLYDNPSTTGFYDAKSGVFFSSSHLPAAAGNMTERLLGSLAAAPAARPFVGPNQAGLEQMLRG